MTPGDKIQKAIDIAVECGGVDGEHHKNWTIDQMVRVLAGDDYERVVALALTPPDDGQEYDMVWYVGIAP